MSNQPICDQDTPDPWIVRSPFSAPQSPLFYLTFTLGDRIEIWSSPNIESFRDPHVRKSIIWQPQRDSPWSADIWAPELHYIHATWWIYAASAQPGQGNPSHRTIVLRCLDQDPMADSSRWLFCGPLKGLPEDQWSIDATVFSPDPPVSPPGARSNSGADSGRRWYICYSGWPLGDHSDTQQDLFIARLLHPLEADRQSLTCISRAELPWERPDNGRRGVNEGPTWVEVSSGPGVGAGMGPSWRGIVYSANGSWTSDYKLGALRFTGQTGDYLCNANLWQKRPTPLLTSDKELGGPFGPGHASFVPTPDGGGVFCVYHGTENEGEGWNNRKGRIAYMTADMFQDHARPVCCAYKVCGAMAASTAQGGYSNMPAQQQQHQQQQPQQYQQHQYPGQGGQQMMQNAGGNNSGGGGWQGGQQGGSGGFLKYADQLESKVPAQYQGMFRKAKGFFK